jgi:hypothetical protein
MTDVHHRVAASSHRRPGARRARAATLLDRLWAVRRLLPPGGAFSHQTAAALFGFGVLRSANVHLTVPTGSDLPDRRGITAHESALPGEVVEVCGLPCLAPARTAVDLARTTSRPDALAALDAALRAGRCTPRSLAVEVTRHDGLRGVRQARDLVPLADARAGRPQESHLRLLLHEGRLPAPALRIPVIEGPGVAPVALGYPTARVGIEYDDGPHRDPRRALAARCRHDRLTRLGWRMRYFTEDDLYRRPDALVQMVRATLRHAAPR